MTHARSPASPAARSRQPSRGRSRARRSANILTFRAELAAAIVKAHRRALKVTGHLCSVIYPEAAALGIDDLDHGFWVDSQADPGKRPDSCPATTGGPTLTGMTPGSPAATALITLLVKHHVALTSTPPVFEPSSRRYRALLTPQARADYENNRAHTLAAPTNRRADRAKPWANELALERASVANRYGQY